MHDAAQQELVARVISNYTVPEFRSTCGSCGRGAAELPAPAEDDLDALYKIIEGFDMYRKEFTPEFAERINRAKYCLGYLNNMQAGTGNGR